MDDHQRFIKISIDNQYSHFFYYNNKQYPIDFDLFKKNSTYFSKNKKELKHTKIIPLFEENIGTEAFDIPETSIKQFINYVHQQQIPLNNHNVLYLSILSQKYQVQSLIESTEKYLNEYQNELALQILVSHQNQPGFETNTYETAISQHFDGYIKNNQIFQLKYSIFYRIFANYQKSEQKNIDSQEMNEFIFKSLDKYGRIASTLFEYIDVNNFGPSNFQRLYTEYSEKIDFHFINPHFMKTLYEAQNELFCLQKKQEEEGNKNIDEMKREMNLIKTAFKKKEEEMHNEINEIRALLMEEKLSNKKKEEEMRNEMKSIIDEKNKMKSKILKLESLNKQAEENPKSSGILKEKQESILKEVDQIKNLLKLIKPSISLENETSQEEFNKLDGEAQITVINAIKSISTNRHIDNLSNFMSYLSHEWHK